MNLGDQIKKLRTSKRMTQAELAKRVSVTKSTISSYENGTRLPSYDVLIKLAELFHVTTDNLLGRNKTYVINVTDLSQEERNVIINIVNAYKTKNIMFHKLRENGMMEEFVREDVIYNAQDGVDDQ